MSYKWELLLLELLMHMYPFKIDHRLEKLTSSASLIKILLSLNFSRLRYTYVHTYTGLLKDNVTNTRNFFAIYECVSSLTSAFRICALV